MKRLSDYDLAILFLLLRGGKLRIPYERNGIPLRILQDKFAVLENTAGRILMSKEPELLFEKNIVNGVFELSLLIPQKHLLKDYLQKYCLNLVADRLRYKENVIEWKIARQEFIKKLVESHYNLNWFHTTSITDIHLLAPDLMKLDYSLNITVNRMDSPLQCNGMVVKQILDSFYESLNFKCSLNVSSIVEKQEEAKPQTVELEPKQKGFTHQQEKIFNFLKRKAKCGTFSFTKYDFEPYVSSLKGNALNSAISKLNMRYKERYNTEKKLIEFNRGEGVYILNNVWNYKNFD